MKHQYVVVRFIVVKDNPVNPDSDNMQFGEKSEIFPILSIHLSTILMTISFTVPLTISFTVLLNTLKISKHTNP